VSWHGVALGCPDWSDKSHALAFTLESLRARYTFHGMVNAYWEPLSFELPPVPKEARGSFRVCIDTALDSPDDIRPWREASPHTAATYLVRPRSLVLLVLALDPA